MTTTEHETIPKNYEGRYIPLFARESIDRYLNHRIPTGGFLEAVLCNNLVESFARADEDNQTLIGTYIKWIYNNAPHDSWGSPEKVKKWLNNGE